MKQLTELFPESYSVSRERFRQNLSRVRERWPEARLSRFDLPGQEGLTIDWIESPAAGENKKVFLLTTAEHGIEGYVGSAMLQRFIDKYLPLLDPGMTGLVLVHAINPWGMEHHRRVNAENVDLNRNFLYDSAGFDPGVNPEYDQVNALLNPPGELRGILSSRLMHLSGLLFALAKLKIRGFRIASLMGQYRYPRGLYYGGLDHQPETRTVMGLFQDALARYDQILHLDMHTGYGPRFQMSLVNSVHETRPSEDFTSRFNYPLVVAANPDEFYPVHGDLVDYFYELWHRDYPEKRFYSAAFEFGTVGEFLNGLIHCPLAMVLENQLFWYGSRSESIRRQAKELFEELFNPRAESWRKKAVADADRAFEGILRAEGYF